MSYEPYNYCYEFIFVDLYGDTVCIKTICFENNYFDRPNNPDLNNPVPDCITLFKQSINDVTPLSDTFISVTPNPTSSEANVMFSIPEKQEVKIEVFNLFGEKVISLIDGLYDEGTHNVKLSTINYNSGMYYITLTTEQTMKTILLNVIK